MGLMEGLGPGPTALDTAVFIYYIEESVEFLSLVPSIFGEIVTGRLEAVTSSLTLLDGLKVLQLRNYL